MKRTAFRKFTSLILAFIMMLPNITSVFAASVTDFVDFPFGWSNEAVTAAVNNGLLNGRSANTIEPEGNLTRAEMATIINRAFGATVEKNISAFGDVSQNEWYYHEIAKAYNMQTFQGDASGTMRPDAFITREEVFAVIARALVLETSDYSPIGRFNDSYAVSEWAKPYASILVAKGYVNGDTMGNLNPLSNITREEFAQIMHNIVKTYHVTAGNHTYAGPASTLIRVGGVTLSNVTVEGDLILGDGVGKGDVTLVNVTIKGRLLARGGEGKVTLTNTTVAGGVVVKDVNGIVNFNNYRTEAPFVGIREITKATFIGEAASQGGSTGGSSGGGGGGGGGTGPAPSAKTVTITYNANGGTVSPSSVTISMNGKISSLPTPTRAGHTFAGWYKNAEGTGDRVTASTTFSASTTIYAKWTKNKYNVSIEAPNGQDKNIEYEYGDTLGSKVNFHSLIPEGKSLEDYKFYYMDGTTEKVVNSDSTVEKELTIYFKEAFLVTYDYGYESKSHAERVFNGEKVGNKYHTASRNGYNFVGWFTSGGQAFTENTLVTAPITVTARWEAINYNITYVSSVEFKEARNDKYNMDTTFTLPVETDFKSHPGKKFYGWYLSDSESDNNRLYEISSGTRYGDITLYAKWVSDSDTSWAEVSLDLNYTGKPENIKLPVKKGNKLTEQELIDAYSSNRSQDGYKISGWYTDAGCTMAFDFTSSISGDITLYAKWEPIKYKLTYHLVEDGAVFVGVSSSAEFTVEDLPKYLYDASKVSLEGKTFKKWHLGSPEGVEIAVIQTGTAQNVDVYAEWEWNKYSVTVKVINNDGATYTDHTQDGVVHNSTVEQVFPAGFERRGYSYNEYSTNPDGTGDKYTASSKIKSALVLYPIWEKVLYNVTLVADIENDEVIFSDGEKEKQISFTIDVETTPLNILSQVSFRNNEAYNFIGWYSKYENNVFVGSQVAEISNISANGSTYYAKWERKSFDVVFALDSGDKTVSYKYGDRLNEAPTKEGYTFAGWNTVPSASVVTYAKDFEVKAPITDKLYPVWDIIEYSVTLVPDIKNNKVEFVVSSDATLSFNVKDFPVSLPTAEKFKNTQAYNFGGWFTSFANGEFTGPVSKIENILADGKTYYAKWDIKTFDVTFVTDGIEEKQSYSYGDKLNKLAQKTGYNKAEWNTKSDGTGDTYTSDSEITEELKLYLCYSEPIDYPITYTGKDVTFNFKQGLSVADIYNVETSTIILPSGEDVVPVDNTQKFIGWYTDINLSTPITKIETGTTGEITLYPKFDLKEKHTVKFWYNHPENDDVYLIDSVYDGFTVAEPVTDPDITGAVFEGWYADSDGNTVFNFAQQILADTNIYARWTAKVYTVKYSDDVVTSDANITHGQKLSDVILTPSKTGYTFEGWNTVSGSDIVTISKDKLVDSEITDILYPVWKPIIYNIILNSDPESIGASVIDHAQIQTEFIITDLPLALPSEDKYYVTNGYTLEGWYESYSNGVYENPVSEVTSISQNEETFYAKWVLKKYTVSYNDGTVTSDASVTHGQKLSDVILTPSKTGYTFEGWNTVSASTTVTVDKDSVVTENITQTLYPVWKPIQYSISFNHNPEGILGVSVKDSSLIKETFIITDLSYALPGENAYNIPEGYKIEGWFESYSNGVYTNPISEVSSIDQHGKTYYAKWVLKTYNVKYYDSATGTNLDASFTHGEKLSDKIPTPVADAGYKFDGWTVNSDGTGTIYKADDEVTAPFEADVIYPKFSPKTLYLTYDFTVEHILKAGKEKQVEFDVTRDVTLYTADDFIENENYRFEYWLINGQKVSAFNAGDYTDDITAVAVWTNIYKVTYLHKANGYTDVVKYVAENENATDLAVADRISEGYKFAGWYYGTNKFDFNTPITQNLTLTAAWEIMKYNVTFDVDDVLTSYKYSHGDSVSLNKSNPEKLGYDFLHWIASDGTSKYYADSLVKSNLILKAVWSEAKEYTITFKANGGTFKPGVSDTQKYTVEEDTIVYSDGIFEKDNTKVFKGWLIEGTNTVITSFAELKSIDGKYCSDIVLLAKWEDALSVTFNTDGGTPVPDVQWIEKDKTAVKPANPEKEGYTFLYWELNGQEYKFTENVTSNITLTAKWHAHSYTVEYNINGVVITGAAPANEEFTYDKASTLPVISARGYDFKGWTVASDGSGEILSGTKAYNLTSQDGARVILYAKWSENEYTINYDANTGSGTTTQQNFKYTNVPNALSANGFTKTGYSFMGWALENDKEKVVFSDGAPASDVLDYIIENTQGKSITLYAVWKPITYFVKYDSNGGTGSIENSVFTYDAESMFSDAENKIERSGYKFKGWEYNGQIYIPSTTYQKLNLSNVQDSVVEVSAKWEPISYTVRYHHGVSQSQASNVSGTTSDSIHTFDDEKALTQNGFERTGYTFKGWTTTPPAGIYSLMNVFSLNTQADDEVVASDSDNTASSDGETKVDYTNGQDVKNLAEEDGDVVILYAVWEANKYTIVYDMNNYNASGFAPPYPQDAVYDEQLTIKTNAGFRLYGHTFLHWNTKPDGTGTTYNAGQTAINLTSEPNGRVTLYVIAKENIFTYILNYRDDTNKIKTTENVKYSDEFTFPGADGYTKTGYSFLGWGNLPNSSNPAKYPGDKEQYRDANDGASIYYYGMWKPNDYKISFNVDGGKPLTDAEIPSDASYSFENGKWVLTVTYDSEYPVLPRPQWVDNKKNFAYWTLSDGTKIVAGQTVKITDETVLTAVWTDEIVHTVIFKDYKLDGGDYVTDVVNGFAIDKPQDPPARVGYTFNGWFEDVYCTQPFDFISDTTEGSAKTYTAYPKWTAHKYEIIFDGNGATSGAMSSQGFKYDDEQKLKANSYVRPGYIFDGWTVNSDGTGTYYENEATILNLTSVDGAKITLYAKWKESPYTVEFDGNGALGAMNSLTFNYTDSISLPANTYTKDGYTFLGWSENKNDTVPSYNDKASKEEFIKALLTSSEGKITLYAVWGENTYTISFDGNGATEGSMSSITLGYSVSQALPENTFTKAGYVFVGWNTKADGTGDISYADKATVKGITATDGATVTLYAQWSVRPYKVSFDMNGATSEAEPVQNVEYGKLATEPQTPVKPGNNFMGWYDGENKFDFTTPITSDITLKAKWSPIYYTVKFNSNGGTTFADKKYLYQSLVINPGTPKKEHYTFVGWYEDEALTKPFIFERYMIKSDITIHAKWTPVEYTITFVPGEGHELKPGKQLQIKYTVETEKIELYNESDFVSDSMYEFDGWVDEKGLPYIEFVKGTTGDMVLTATWKKVGKDYFEVRFFTNHNVDDDNIFIVKDVEKDTLVNSDGIIVGTPERKGYKFMGWYLDKNCSSGNEFSLDKDVITQYTELYAKWSIETYDIIYVLNGGQWEDDAVYATTYTVEDEIILSRDVKNEATREFTGWLTTDKNLAKPTPPGALDLNPPPSGYYHVEKIPVGTTGNLMFVAHWKGTSGGGPGGDETKTYYVELIVDGAQYLAGEIPEDSLISIGFKHYENPTKAGYEFVEWNTSSDGTGVSYNPYATIIEEAVTLYAVWKKLPLESYIITYNNIETSDMANASAFVLSYTKEDEITLPKLSDFNERANGEVFAGWYDNAEFTGEPVTTITKGSQGDKTFWAKWEQSFIVRFHRGAIAVNEEHRKYIGDARVVAGTSMAQSDIDAMISGVNKKQLVEYYDGSYSHTVNGELWYVDSGEWKIFNSEVKINADTDVFYANKFVSLCLNVELGGFTLDIPGYISVPYSSDTKLIESAKDLMTAARSKLSMALATDDIYARAIEKAAEKTSEKDINLIDADGNLKFVDIDTAISNIIKPQEIDGEIAKYIEKIIVNNSDDEKIESAILMVYKDSDLIKDTVLGGGEYDFATIKAYIDSLDSDERVEFADHIHDILEDEPYYYDFIDAFEKGHDHFVVSHENLNFVMAVATAVNDYTYEELKDKIYAKFGKVIDVLGDDVAKEFMQDAQLRYYEGAHVLWDDMKDHTSDENYKSSYPSYLTFKVNAVDHVFKPMFDKYRVKVIDKLIEKNFYHYADNTYLRELVEMDADTIVNDLLYTVPVTEENIGYALWPSENGESGFMHYYDYLFHKLLIADNARLWYVNNLHENELEELRTSVYENIAKALNKANEMLASYEKDGSLPMGKNISDLMEIEAFAKIFNKVEGKLIKVLEKFKTTQFYGKEWTADSVRYDVPYSDLAGNVILGTDEPAFNVDSLLDDKYVGKALSKAGFKEFEDSFDADIGSTVTVQAIERLFRNNRIEIRRYYE